MENGINNRPGQLTDNNRTTRTAVTRFRFCFPTTSSVTLERANHVCANRWVRLGRYRRRGARASVWTAAKKFSSFVADVENSAHTPAILACRIDKSVRT